MITTHSDCRAKSEFYHAAPPGSLHLLVLAATMPGFYTERRMFARDRLALLALYEHNYMGFRLVVPVPPEDNAWYILKADSRADIYLRRLSSHPYTSEWQLGHIYPRRRRSIAPDYTIRIYHDMRLAEAMIDPAIPIRDQRTRKIAQNRALREWLDYCHRYRYRMNGALHTETPLP